MTEELTLRVTDVERKAIAFCREKDAPYPIANYLVDFANEVTKELQEATKKFKSDYHELCNLQDMRIAELEKQVEKMKSDVKSNIKWADQNKNDQMWQKLVKMYNQWS